MSNRVYDLIVVGAGLIGLSLAYEYQKKFPQDRILILEKENDVAQHQSSRNSGVIHSGIYYEPGSLKAHTCLLGRQLLLQFCQEEGVPWVQRGKYIAAFQESELQTLKLLERRALSLGLAGVHLHSTEKIREKEPYLAAKKALWVPQAAVLSFSCLAKKLEEKLQKQAVQIQYESKVIAINRESSSICLVTQGNHFLAKRVLNAAGQHCDEIYAMDEQARPDEDIKIFPFLGQYYSLKKEKSYLVRSLIYPCPRLDLPFLGVHCSRGIHESVHLGPSASFAWYKENYEKKFTFSSFWKACMNSRLRALAYEFLGSMSYELMQAQSSYLFYKQVKKMIPDLRFRDLEYCQSGIRAQAVTKNGKLYMDFYIKSLGAVTHVLNAPSPAASSCFAIARHILQVMKV